MVLTKSFDKVIKIDTRFEKDGNDNDTCLMSTMSNNLYFLHQKMSCCRKPDSLLTNSIQKNSFV